MRYIIDTANDEQIQEALDMGACGVTANPSMYLKNQQNFYEFVKKYAFGGSTAEIPEVRIAALGNDAGIIGAANF